MQHKIDVRENVGNRVNRQDFDQSVSRKHFLSTQDIRNVKRSVLERQIKRHENDATSVDIFVQELQFQFCSTNHKEMNQKSIPPSERTHSSSQCKQNFK